MIVVDCVALIWHCYSLHGLILIKITSKQTTNRYARVTLALKRYWSTSIRIITPVQPDNISQYDRNQLTDSQDLNSETNWLFFIFNCRIWHARRPSRSFAQKSSRRSRRRPIHHNVCHWPGPPTVRLCSPVTATTPSVSGKCPLPLVKQRSPHTTINIIQQPTQNCICFVFCYKNMKRQINAIFFLFIVMSPITMQWICWNPYVLILCLQQQHKKNHMIFNLNKLWIRSWTKNVDPFFISFLICCFVLKQIEWQTLNKVLGNIFMLVYKMYDMWLHGRKKKKSYLFRKYTFFFWNIIDQSWAPHSLDQYIFFYVEMKEKMCTTGA